ncbi:MAG: hypothetical protein WEE89_17620 [Gemmatimonadota bacterium]
MSNLASVEADCGRQSNVGYDFITAADDMDHLCIRTQHELRDVRYSLESKVPRQPAESLDCAIERSRITGEIKAARMIVAERSLVLAAFFQLRLRSLGMCPVH